MLEYLLMETEDKLLQESGGGILLESSSNPITLALSDSSEWPLVATGTQ